jgi:ribosome-associated protein
MKETIQNQKTPRAAGQMGITSERDEEQLLFESVQTAVHAAEEKKAEEIVVLKLAEITSFTDYFVICSGKSSRQVQAIADEVTAQLKKRGVRPLQTEGYANAEWILIDYGPMVVHVFSDTSRRFYDLERLWRDAERIEL